MYNDFYIFSIDKNEWKKICTTESPGPRSSQQMVIFPNGNIYLFGGEFVSPNETSFFHYKDFWRFIIKESKWEQLRIKVPPPRSGHRMVAYKHYIVLFGGFYDTFKETKYYDDLWIYDTQMGEWSSIPCDPKPEPRSGFQFLAFQDYMLLYGGYCKITAKGQKTTGMVYSDIWVLTINPKTHSIKWEKKKKAGGFVPSLRSGCTMVPFKGRGILFGGVSDLKESEDTLESICHNDAYQYHETNKWYPLTVKNQESCPIPRFNAMMAVYKNTLYLYGGILELGDKEFYLEDLWSVSLDKLNEWNCITSDESSRSTWLGEESDDSSDSDESNDFVVDSEESDDESEALPMDCFESSIIIDDPTPKESLREYFLRTCVDWQRRSIEIFEKSEESPSFTGKSLRRDAFQMAQYRYKVCQPALSILRKKLEQEELELVQKQDKSNESISFRHRDR
jgi:N-acetylneuraminic acid mutarotase